MQQNITQHLYILLRRPRRHVVNDVPAGTISGEVHVDFRVLPTLKPWSWFDPLQSIPPILVRTWVPMLRRPAIVNGDDDGLTNADEAAAEGVVDGAVSGGMRKASAVEEDYDGDDVCDA